MDVLGGTAVNSTPSPAQPMLKPEDEPDFEIILLMIILSVFALVGSIGNGLVIFVFQRVRDKSTAQLFILFLALIDLLTCVIIIPMTAFVEFTEYKMKSDLLCKTYHFLVNSKTPLSLFIMVAIAVDRYMCICRPMQRIITRTKARVIIVALSIMAFTVGAFSLLFNGVYHSFYMIDLRKIDQEAGTNFTKSTTGVYREDILMTLHMKNYSFPDCTVNFPYGDKEEAAEVKAVCELQSLPQVRQVVNVEFCDVSFIHLSESIFYVYQRAYKCLFPLCLVIVFILYSLIYRFMCKRRARKLQQKLILCSYVNGDGTYENTRLVSTPPGPEGHGERRSSGDGSVVDTPDKFTNLNSDKIVVKPVSVPLLVCLVEDSDVGNQKVLIELDVQDETIPPANDSGQSPSSTSNGNLQDPLEINNKLSNLEKLVDNKDDKFAHNLMTDNTPSPKAVKSPCSAQIAFSSHADGTNLPNHLSTEFYHPLEKNHLLQPLSPHTNNNYCKERSPVSENIISHDFTSDCRFDETNCSKFDLLSDENSSRLDINGSRRSSHCHAKQKYQWHKKRDSMRRYKGKGPRDSSRSGSDREHGSRRRSPLSLEAERLSKENWKANVRTALMLFTVTFVFIVAYTPGWMMAMRIIPHHKIVFYLYFSYNVANPFIYAFMNHVFKRFMYKVFTCKNAPQSRI